MPTETNLRVKREPRFMRWLQSVLTYGALPFFAVAAYLLGAGGDLSAAGASTAVGTILLVLGILVGGYRGWRELNELPAADRKRARVLTAAFTVFAILFVLSLVLVSTLMVMFPKG